MPDLSKAFLMELAETKLNDAKFLLAGGRSGNAYYLAGYAIELLLKAVLASRFRAIPFLPQNWREAYLLMT